MFVLSPGGDTLVVLQNAPVGAPLCLAIQFASGAQAAVKKHPRQWLRNDFSNIRPRRHLCLTGRGADV